jgi:hypothetical protein
MQQQKDSKEAKAAKCRIMPNAYRFDFLMA